MKEEQRNLLNIMLIVFSISVFCSSCFIIFLIDRFFKDLVKVQHRSDNMENNKQAMKLCLFSCIIVSIPLYLAISSKQFLETFMQRKTKDEADMVLKLSSCIKSAAWPIKLLNEVPV